MGPIRKSTVKSHIKHRHRIRTPIMALKRKQPAARTRPTKRPRPDAEHLHHVPKQCFSSMPEELVDVVWELLKYGSLAKLCRTSQRCKRIAEHVLYKAVGPYTTVPRTFENELGYRDHEIDTNWSDIRYGWNTIEAFGQNKSFACAQQHMREVSVRFPCLKDRGEASNDRHTLREVLKHASLLISLGIHDCHRDLRGSGWLEVLIAGSVGMTGVLTFQHLKRLSLNCHDMNIDTITSMLPMPSLEDFRLDHFV